MGQPMNTADHRQGDKHFLSDLLHGVYCGVSIFVTGSDIEKGNLIGALLIIANRDLHRVARVADINEIDTLHHPAVFHVQAGNNTFRQTH